MFSYGNKKLLFDIYIEYTNLKLAGWKYIDKWTVFVKVETQNWRGVIENSHCLYRKGSTIYVILYSNTERE